ncbi:MAG: diacylglycerol kinase family protein [bacterium]
MKKALVIFSPGAGLSVRQDVRLEIDEKLKSAGFEADWFVLDSKFEEKILAHDMSVCEMVVAVGGDGTVKVAARTILQNKINIPLLIIPFGSANVIAVTLGIPTNIKSALKLLTSKKTMAIDVGIINNLHYFLVGFSVGYISKIVTGTSKNLKSKFGFFGYPLRFIFNRIRIKKIKFEVKTKNRTFWVKGNSLIIFNAFNYYGFQSKKQISLTDGILNLYVFTSKTFLSLIEAFFYVLLFQKPPRHVFSLDNNYFKLHLRHGRKSCQIDGDYIELPPDIELRVLPSALKIVV